jgi:ADP-ribose pyrophosphatase YjhB (NUDIX family)
MTGNHDSDSLDSLTDPATLRDHADVDFRERTEAVDAADFEDATDLDSHVAVGVADHRGVLLQNDGHHGWTLPAFAVDAGEDWLAVARREFESLTGAAVEVDAVERVRRLEYRVPVADDRATIWNVVVRATTDDSLSDDPESRVDDTDVRWFDRVPEDVEGPVAADVECVVNADTARK